MDFSDCFGMCSSEYAYFKESAWIGRILKRQVLRRDMAGNRLIYMMPSI